MFFDVQLYVPSLLMVWDIDVKTNQNIWYCYLILLLQIIENLKSIFSFIYFCTLGRYL